MTRLFRISAFATAFALVAACGGADVPTGENSGDQPTPAEVDLLVSALFGDLDDVGEIFAASRQPSIPLPGGISFSVAGVPINETFNESDSCSGGGNVSVSGSVTGEFDDQTGEGKAEFEATQRISGCVVTGESTSFTVNTAPDIRIVGDVEATQNTFSFSLEIGGGLRFTTEDGREGTCNVRFSMSVTASSSGTSGSASASVSGSVCGRDINNI